MSYQITKLTPEQEAQIPAWCNRWIAAGLCVGPADRARFERGARVLYDVAKIAWPNNVVWVQSPAVGAIAAPISAAILTQLGTKVTRKAGAVNEAVRRAVRNAMGTTVDKAVSNAVGEVVAGAIAEAADDEVSRATQKVVGRKLQWHSLMHGQFWPAWHAWRSFFLDVCRIDVTPEVRRISDAYGDTVLSAAYWWPNTHFVIACERPTVIRRNAAGQLHADGKLAIEWPDGWGLWVLNGVRVPREIAEPPGEKLDPKLVMTEKNAEVRRELVRKIGIERVCSALGAKVVDKQGNYELLMLELGEGDGRTRPFLKMLNPSIGVYHVEGVPPDCVSVKAALAWRNGREDSPVVLT